MTMLRSMLVFLYSLVITALIPVIRFLSLFHKQLRDQLDGRPRLIKFGRQIGKMRAHKKRALMILASSAGEYEQARPIIDRLTRSSDVFVHVVFWSQSGATYAKKRGETVSWSLAPFDTTWQ